MVPFKYRLTTALAYPLIQKKLRDVQGTELLPQTGGYVLAANHIDWLDAFYIAAAVHHARQTPVFFLTATNNWWWTSGAIPIPPNKGEIVNVAISHLQQGRALCNFVESRRNSEPKLLPGKTGTVRMAIGAGVPVVPVGLRSDAGKNLRQSVKFLLSSQHLVTIHFGQPMRFVEPAGGLTKEWLEYETRKLMAAIAPLCSKEI